MKRVYAFYIHAIEIKATEYPGVLNSDIVHKDHGDYAFYAWTSDKFIRKLFKELRRLDIFFEKIFNIDDTVYEQFEIDNPDTKLLTIPVTTQCDSKVTDDNPFVISTRREMDYIIFHQDIILEEILSPERFDINVRLINPRVFKSKYKKALRTSGFNNIIKLIYSDKPEDKRIKDMNLDILALYIKIYKGLYKGGVM